MYTLENLHALVISHTCVLIYLPIKPMKVFSYTKQKVGIR